jgi:hypothetical protein
VYLKVVVLVAMVFFAFLSFGHPRYDSPIELATIQSVIMYANTYGLDLNKPTPHFVGFSSVKSTMQIDVEVFHADSPLDILVNQYACTSDSISISGTNCNLISQYPRCFYYADTGQFSISDYGIVLGQGIHALSHDGVKGDAITAIKIWQSGHQVFSKISFEKSGANATKIFSCNDTVTGLSCSEADRQIPNEP